MRAIALLLALELAACGGMQHTDAGLEAAFLTASYVDMLQTEAITSREHCGVRWVENNPAIGTCGDGPLGVHGYFALVWVGHMIITAALPKGTARTVWQALTLGVAVKTIHTNRIDGVPIGR